MKKKQKEECEESWNAETEEGRGNERAAISAQETKQVLLRRILANVRQQLDHAERLLANRAEIVEGEEPFLTKLVGERLEPMAADRIVEGVFDGEQMIGEDGRPYQVPPNYASKSKLVEGDLLRLTITDDGRFLFKQRGPIERQRLMGALMQDEQTNEWKVFADGKKYRVLTASVTFFKGQTGDDAVILVPRGAPSHWAAMENVVKREE